MMRRCIAFFLLLLTACAPRPDNNAQILAIGDSILAWNRLSGRDVITLVGEKTGLTVQSRAQNGANFMREGGITTQYRSGNWDYVILNGGGNDIASVCFNATAAAGRVDALVAPDDLAAYAIDRVHPTLYATNLMAGKIAEAIARLN